MNAFKLSINGEKPELVHIFGHLDRWFVKHRKIDGVFLRYTNVHR